MKLSSSDILTVTIKKKNWWWGFARVKLNKSFFSCLLKRWHDTMKSIVLSFFFASVQMFDDKMASEHASERKIKGRWHFSSFFLLPVILHGVTASSSCQKESFLLAQNGWHKIFITEKSNFLCPNRNNLRTVPSRDKVSSGKLLLAKDLLLGPRRRRHFVCLILSWFIIKDQRGEGVTVR